MQLANRLDDLVDELDRADNSPTSEPTFSAEKARLGLDPLTQPPPAPPFLIADLLLDRMAGVLAGAGGTAKSTLALFICVLVCTGRAFAEHQVLRPGPILYISGEDPRPVMHYRLHKICAALELSSAELERVAKTFYIEDFSGADLPLIGFIDGNFYQTHNVGGLIEAYQHLELSLIIIDPKIAFGGADENLNTEAKKFMMAANRIANGCSCSVLVVHHIAKASAANADETADFQYLARGGAALIDAARFALNLVPHAPNSKAKLPPWIDTQDVAAGNVTRLHVVKLSHGRHPQQPLWCVRNGFQFDWKDGVSLAQVSVNASIEVLRHVRFLTGRDFTISKRRLTDEDDDLKIATGLTRPALRTLVTDMISDKCLMLRDLPPERRQGRLTQGIALGPKGQTLLDEVAEHHA